MPSPYVGSFRYYKFLVLIVQRRPIKEAHDVAPTTFSLVVVLNNGPHVENTIGVYAVVSTHYTSYPLKKKY
jgi:hypothetical protein